MTQAELTAICEAGKIIGKHSDRDCTKLDTKLVEALEKLNKGALESAIGKLEGFKERVLDLDNEGKMKETSDAELLVNDAEAAISCVEDLN